MATDEISLELFPEMDGVELIQKVDLFHTLGFEDTLALAGIARVEKFTTGARLIEQDSLAQALYIIREGNVTVTRRDSRGEEDRLAQLGAGALVGEMSLIESDLASANIIADGEVEALVIPRKEFEQLLEENERLALHVYKAFCRSLSARLRKTSIQLSESR